MRGATLLLTLALLAGCFGEAPSSKTDEPQDRPVRDRDAAFKAPEPFVVQVLNETYRFPRDENEPPLPNVSLNAPARTNTFDLLVTGTLECDVGQAIAEWSGTRFRFHGPANATRDVYASFEETGDDGGLVLCDPLDPPSSAATIPHSFPATAGSWTVEFLGTCTCRVDLVMHAAG